MATKKRTSRRRSSRRSRGFGDAAVRVPSRNVEWTSLAGNAHVVMGGKSGKVYVATIWGGPHHGKKAVVTWSGHDAADAQRFLDARVRMSTPAARRSR